MKRFKNILFFADGSEEMTPALPRAAQLAESNQARLTVVDVIEPVDTPDEILSRFNIELNESDSIKYQRVQESALLRTLGASSKQVRLIIATEYAMLGAAAGLTGITLAIVAGWALTEFLFRISLSVSLPTVVGAWLGLVLVTVGIGAWSSRGVTTKPPLATLRELSE